MTSESRATEGLMANLHQLRHDVALRPPRLPLCSLRGVRHTPIGCSNQSCKDCQWFMCDSRHTERKVGSQRPTPARRFRRMGAGARQEAGLLAAEKTKANFGLGRPLETGIADRGYAPCNRAQIMLDSRLDR